MPHPYADLPTESFWETGVAAKGVFELQNLWRPRWPLTGNDRFATYGSCFAQRVSQALVARGLNWSNCEPGPKPIPEDLAKDYNFGVYSSRTGNLYTARQLLCWARLATTGTDQGHTPEFWPEGDGFRDSLRPAIEPRPFQSLQEAQNNRAETIRAFRQSIATSDVLLFTMGLTEGWEHAQTGLPYALCPGTAAGTFDAQLHQLRQYRFAEILQQFTDTFELIRRINPELKVLLTVSPVSMVATASEQHVLVANMQTKSLLRAVASELVLTHDFVDYFPSYELIASPAVRGIFYHQNQRTIAAPGVAVVMDHFFSGLGIQAPDPAREPTPYPAAPAAARHQESAAGAATSDDLVCEEIILDKYANDQT